jgi:hypothetical protein
MITSKPVTEARLNRGTGLKNLGGVGEGKCNPSTGGSYVFDDKRKEWVRLDEPMAKKDMPMYGDYALARDVHKTVEDYIRFKNKFDREKINNEFYGKQEEYRRKVSRELTLTKKIMEG